MSPDVEGSGGAVTPPAAAAVEPQTFSLDYVRELRAENKGWRLKAQQLETATNEAKTAAEKAVAEAAAAAEKANKGADARVAEFTSATNQRLIRAELKAGAAQAGLAHADFLKLIDASALKVGDDGEVQVPADFWTKAKESLPHLFKTTGADTGTTSNTQQTPKPAPTTGKRAEELNEAEYNAALARLTAPRR